ncbi:PAS domain-containing protein [Streptomyces sp. WMMB 322]|uniref:PAS domain-containing protein n=1 Tax=Streptomyces sp. WMMB 322 TaxID=1286821 RepID=UPI0006E37450|nr:PAS domain-containing protein [Streptomyces sp. WMMB 322]SCK13298.1 PAS domain S-box-containing protein [Streptomyces sp. WMMB 322]
MSSRPSRGAARLAAILDALPDALLLVNCNGTVVNANTIALEAFEAPGTALVGRGLLDLLPEFDSKRIPGSMRRPDEAAAELEQRQRPTRMVARRTDGSEFYVEVTSANLEDGRTPYASAFEAAFADHGPGHSYTGDELLMLVVRDLTGTLDTEAELARQQRQTEMILRAASEGVLGVDTEGLIVLVNPAAAQILGYRAGDLGGQELHSLLLHSRPDGSPLPYEETTLSDTLKSGRKHRVRAGTVLWAKDGQAVPVDITTAPVRDGDQLVGAVVTFSDRRAQEALASRHEQLLAVLQDSLRGPLDRLRDELSGLAADPAGQLWPEANQILHHLAAGYARMTTLVDNVLGYQRLDAGREKLRREMTSLDSVVANGVEGAVELIGPGRAQFAVHAPPIEAEVDGERLTTALAHLIADVAGVDATGNTTVVTPGADTTIVVAAAQRGDVVRIEVRGPYSGGNPVHLPIVRGTVERHGGVLQTHEVPGAGGSAYVLEVPLKADAGGGAAETSAGGDRAGATGGGSDRRGRDGHETTVMPVPAQPVRGTEAPAAEQAAGAWTGTGDVSDVPPAAGIPDQFQARNAQDQQQASDGGAPTGRRRGRPSAAEEQHQHQQQAAAAQGGAVPQLPAAAGDSAEGAEHAGAAVPQQAGAGRRARRTLSPPPPGTDGAGVQAHAADGEDAAGVQRLPAQQQAQPGTGRRGRRPVQEQPGQAAPPEAQPVQPQQGQSGQGDEGAAQSGGRRARRLARAQTEGEAVPQGAQYAAPPGQPQPGSNGAGAVAGEAVPAGQQNGAVPQQVPAQQVPAQQVPAQQVPAQQVPAQQVPAQQSAPPPEQEPEQPEQQPVEHSVVAASPILGGGPLPQNIPQQPRGLPMPGAPSAEEQASYETGHHRVQTLGQGVPVAPGTAERPGGPQSYGHSVPRAVPSPHQGHTPAPGTAIPSTPSTPPGSGRRRKLAEPAREGGQQPAGRPGQARRGPAPGRGNQPPAREFTIGAPAAGSAEGPEPLDGPNSPVEMSDGRGVPVPAQGVDDELPPEPLDNPRRLLVWPEPDAATQHALAAHGYRPVVVHSRDEVAAQIAARPAALFVDPLTGPITRTALQSLRTAAVAAQVPVMVTSGLGQATREAAYGADPAVLLKALAPRDSEQHPPRVLLVEERPPIAGALAASLERRGIQVAHAQTDELAVNVAAQMRPNLVVMDAMQVSTRRPGIIDWLRVNGLLSRTPFVIYTSADMNPADLPRLATGETVLFLAERSTSDAVQQRIVDMLRKIGAQ